MSTSVAADWAIVTRQYGHHLGGKQVSGASGRSGNSFNPATGQVQKAVAIASADETRAAKCDSRAVHA